MSEIKVCKKSDFHNASWQEASGTPEASSRNAAGFDQDKFVIPATSTKDEKSTRLPSESRWTTKMARGATRPVKATVSLLVTSARKAYGAACILGAAIVTCIRNIFSKIRAFCRSRSETVKLRVEEVSRRDPIAQASPKETGTISSTAPLKANKGMQTSTTAKPKSVSLPTVATEIAPVAPAVQEFALKTPAAPAPAPLAATAPAPKTLAAPAPVPQAEKEPVPAPLADPELAPKTLAAPAPVPQAKKEPTPAPSAAPEPAPKTLAAPAPVPQAKKEPTPAPSAAPAPAPKAAPTPVPQAKKEPRPAPSATLDSAPTTLAAPAPAPAAAPVPALLAATKPAFTPAAAAKFGAERAPQIYPLQINGQFDTTLAALEGSVGSEVGSADVKSKKKANPLNHRLLNRVGDGLAAAFRHVQQTRLQVGLTGSFGPQLEMVVLQNKNR